MCPAAAGSARESISTRRTGRDAKRPRNQSDRDPRLSTRADAGYGAGTGATRGRLAGSRAEPPGSRTTYSRQAIGIPCPARRDQAQQAQAPQAGSHSHLRPKLESQAELNLYSAHLGQVDTSLQAGSKALSGAHAEPNPHAAFSTGARAE